MKNNFSTAMREQPHIIILYILLSLLLLSCNGNSSRGLSETGDTLCLRYAKNLTIVTYPDHTEVTMRNPWDTTGVLAKYSLIQSKKLKEKNGTNNSSLFTRSGSSP
ncbi:MAG: hypothetical protein IK144_12590 [Bacteroidaceae bacterium]|nr:hypothetical protein [Bacteroidaceae bacterium]